MIAATESHQEPVMKHGLIFKHALIFVILALVASEAAMAQGVAQSPTTTVNQQRQQTNSLVNGSPTSAVATSPPSPNGTFGSPFTSPFSSPFGTSSAAPRRGGYAGNK
jgi:hypothetical protein